MSTHLFIKARLNLLFLKLVYAKCLQLLRVSSDIDVPFNITLRFFFHDVDFVPDILKEHINIVRAKIDKNVIERKLLEKYY